MQTVKRLQMPRAIEGHPAMPSLVLPDTQCEVPVVLLSCAGVCFVYEYVVTLSPRIF